METVRRLRRDESGMTMGLAVIMILLLGVMGAGLLTFVSKDLNTVVEVNQGQRAFELADAGVAAAKRQLASDVDRTKYDDDPSDPPVDDSQWSAANDGLTLTDLDGNGTTPDTVNVTIEYKAETADFPEHFQVISTGTYGTARRKIEALFKGVEVAAGGGETIGRPLYYTPSSIRVEPTVNINAISMFSESDILIGGLTTNPATPNPQQSFVDDYEANRGGFTIGGTADKLCDWDTDTPTVNGCFEDSTGNWNTVGRTWVKNKNATVKEYYDRPGFGATGKICGYVTTDTTTGTCGASPSVADGMYGYDSTTGAKTMMRPDYKLAWGNNLTFVDKEDLLGPGGDTEANPAGTISFPFPRPRPIPANLKTRAQQQTRYYSGTTPPWVNLFRNVAGQNGNEKVVFVDAQGSSTPLNFSTDDAAKNTGTLVVWCGRLVQNQNFKGIILSLYGDGSAFGASSCDNTVSGQQDVGTYRNSGFQCQCWNYAEGGTEARAGIELMSNSNVDFLPSGEWSFLNDAFEGPPPTSFALEGWRELYE